jgi:hypothetical protein
VTSRFWPLAVVHLDDIRTLRASSNHQQAVTETGQISLFPIAVTGQERNKKVLRKKQARSAKELVKKTDPYQCVQNGVEYA